MPQLPAARRLQGEAAPARRRRWRCPVCGAVGWAQNAHSAYVAGTRHWIDEHDAATQLRGTP